MHLRGVDDFVACTKGGGGNSHSLSVVLGCESLYNLRIVFKFISCYERQTIINYVNKKSKHFVPF